MRNINNFIDKNIEKILIVFLYMQPILDVLTAVMLNTFKIDFTIGIIIRFIFMLFMTYYLLFINKNKDKKKSIIYVLSIFIYMVLFLINILNIKGRSNLLFDFKSLIKTYYFIIVLISFFEIYKNKKNNIDYKHFRNLFIIYSLFVLIPNLLNIGYSSYKVTKEGMIGLFNTANEISAIISILMPVFIYDILKRKNLIITIIVSIVLLYLLTSIGTKGPLLSLGIIIIYYLIKYIRKWIKDKKYKPLIISVISIIIIMIGGIILIPKTTFYKNIKVHLEFLKVDEVSDLTKPKIFDHFVFSSRLKFWSKTNDIYLKSDFKTKLLGIGYVKKNGKNMKMVEMDYVDIFYRHGIVGFIIYMSGFIYVLVIVVKNTKSIKKKSLYYTYLLSIFLALLLSLLTGHVITSPGVAIYVALLINIFYNSEIREDEENV